MSSTVIRHKRSAVSGKIPQPSQLEPGELAVNTADGKIFLLKDDNTIADITQGIFQNDTSVVVTDENDSSQGIVSITVDNSEKINITDASINLKDSVVIENANTLTFRESVGGGLAGISIKAPDNLVSSYSLTLPTGLGPKGSLIGLDDNGELYFSNADIYGGKNVFVSSENGDDTNDGINLPVRSIKRACQIASEMVYNVDSTINGTRVTIKVAGGDYSENNPVIVPDNVVIKGDGLRGCIIRPQNANQDMLRVRNGSYFAEFTFRDAIDANFVPLFTFDYAVAFDDPDDVTVSRTGYNNLPDTKPTITSSPYVQNCSLISFLGGNGAKIDGSKVNSPNVPILQIEVENPVVGPAPEQGKSMVSNAFTMLSFGGTGWRLINDAYAQIVSCFQIFMLNGVYTQSGGYCSITNSATNFGLYALRSSGYSSRTFSFDRGYVFSTGVSSGAQTITVVGVNRTSPVEEFVLRFREPEYKIAYDLIESEKNTIADDTIDWIDTQISTATPGSLWYNFTYNESMYRAAFLIILDAVAKDTWGTGNALSRQVTLSYFSNRLADSSNLTISEEEDQFTAAIEQLSAYTNTVITSLDSTVKSFVDEKFDLIKNGISEPNTIPDAVDVSSEGDISNNYKNAGTEVTFDAATGVSVTFDIITKNNHGLINGQAVVYDSNGNAPIAGLDPEQTYYVKLINANEFSLAFDESLEFNVNIRATGTGTHKFVANVSEFFVNDILSSHTTYQTLILESGAESYNFVPGRAITGSTGVNNNSAIVYSWKPADRELVVSIELVTVGAATQRVQFDETSTISNDHSVVPNTNIGVNEVSAKTGLSTSTFTVGSTVQGGLLTNLVNLLEKQIWFHRPSVVNSSSHTWEYAGSGIDYNALPQNGGNTREEYEQYQELPGRVYTSGTNELGDFKVGNFITAFNRTGNIVFRNKVTVDELDVLRLAFSDVVIEEISKDVNLGDDELGGPSDSRLSTQLAMRSFLSNRLGGFIDKTVSTAAVPGAIVQLNTNGQLNAELIPATRQFTSTTTNGYLSKLLQVDEIPAVDLKAGDIATEEYEQIELTLSGNITAADGDTITQPSTGAIGYAKGDYGNSPTIIVASIGGEFKVGDDSTGSDFDTAGTIFVNAVSSGVYPTSLGTSAAITENFFLKSSNTSQYLVLSNDDSYTFTSASISSVSRSTNVATITTVGNHNLQAETHIQVICTSDSTFTVNAEVISTPTPTSFTIPNTGSDTGSTAATGTVRTIVSSADGNAQGAVTETRYGVLTNVDNANITGGSGYTPLLGTETYEFVTLTTTSGVGTGAIADITVTAGQVTDVNLRRGGTGYAVGDTLSANAVNIGGTGSSFEIDVLAIEKRAYVNILGGELFVASPSSIDFVEDNTAPTDKKTVTLTTTVSKNFLAGDSGAGGNVNYTTNQITISSHGLTNGDPVKYDTLGNVAIGGLLNGSVYYAKSINSSTIELYEDYSLLNKIEFSSTPANNNHNITRFTVNVIDNSVVIPAHGFTTGSAVRFEGNDLFDISGTQVESGSRFFIGSVTTNSFTLHELRSEALASINGLVTGAKNIDGVGTGTAIIYPQNVRVNSVVNTSSRIKANWNSLTASNIDASNIVSGTVSPSRLASSGTANTDTFLRGDSSYQTVVQSLKKANTTDNPITLTGSNVAGEFYGDPVNIGISNVDLDVGQAYSTLGVARFLQSQFDVDVNATGQVFIKNGVVDAGTLDSLDSAYFLNPANLTSNVPVNRGGTNLSTYVTGDMIYAQSSGTLGTLTIGRANSFLRSTGTIPEWSTALELAEGLDVGSARLSSTSIGIGTVYNENITSIELGSNAETVKIGKSTATRAITAFVSGYDASISTTVAVNLTSFTASTNAVTASGSKEIPIGSTSGILYGMLVTGSPSIPADTIVTGVTANYIYLSAETTGTITSTTSLTFTYTPLTLGIRAGDTVNIASSGITNLDGQWHVLGATSNANSFTIAVAASVTANPASPVAGSITKDNTILFRNRNVIFGGAEASASPIAATLKGESGIGTNVAGGNFVIQGGLSTGNATSGGAVIIRTGQTGSSGIVEQTSTTRLTIDTAGKATFTGEVGIASTLSTSASTVSVIDTTATTVNAFGETTTLNLGYDSTAASTTNISTGAVASATTKTVNLGTGGAAGSTTNINIGAEGTTIFGTGTVRGNKTTQDIFDTVATTINFAGAATTGNFGYNSTAASTTNISTGAVANATTKTVNLGTGGASGSTTNINIGSNAGGTTTINSGTVVGTATTQNLFNTTATTVNAFGAGTAISIGAGTGDTTVNNNLIVSGNLTVNGTTTTVNSTTLSVDDKNIELGSIASPSNITADGGGITLRGTSDKTFNWVNATGSWTSSEDLNLLTGKVFRIAGTSVLSATTLGSGVTASSLTSVGTISTGVWQGSVIDGAYGGTGVANTGKTITLGGNFVTSGAFNILFATTNNTNVTLPTAGTLATIENPLSQFAATTSLQLAGVISDETGSGKLVFGTSPTFTTSLLTDSTSISVFNTTATTVNAFGASTVITMGAASSMVTFGDDITVTGLTKSTQGIQFGATDSLLSESGSNAVNLRIGADGPFINFADSGSNVATLSNTSGPLTIATGAGNGNITFTPNGTGNVIVSSGNLGIGTGGSPATKLDVVGSITARAAATQDGVILAGRAGGTSTYAVTITPATLSANRTVTLPDGNVTLQTGTAAVTSGTLAQFAATTSLQLAGVISDETGSGALVFANTPTLVTPVLGVATATSINKVAITAPATGSTLTIADGKTLTASNTLTFTGTDSSSVAFGGGGTVAYTANKLSVFASTTSAELAGVISDETGSGKLVFGTSPTFTTSVLTDSSTISVFNTTATTVNAFGATTTLNLGYDGTAASTTNISTGANASATIKTINIGTGGAAGSSTTVNIGSSIGGSVVINSTSIIGTSSSQDVFNGGVTTVSAFGSATTINMGHTATGPSTYNFATGATGSGSFKTVNLGTGGAAGSSTTVNIGSNVAGTTVINSPNITLDTIADTTDTASHYYVETSSSRNILPKTLANVRTEIVTTAAVNSAAATTVGTVTSGTWSASFGAVSGANLTNLTAGNLAGTIPSAVLGNSSLFVGTTSIALNRASLAQSLTGVSIDGNAGTVTNGVYTTGDQTIGGTKTFSSTITGSISGNAGTVTNGVYTTGNQSIGGIKTFTGDIISTAAWDATEGGGQIYLNGATGNRIDWNTNGVAAPTFTTRSAGTKVVYYPGVTASAADYAAGIDSGTLWHSVPTTTQQFRWYGGTTIAATLTGAGAFTAANEVTAYSDARIKDNITVIADPLTKVLSIRGVNYTRTDLEDKDRVYMGVIAQEVEQYIPEVVTTLEDGTKTVNYGAMAGLFIEAIKTQQAQINELRAMIQKLADK